MNTGTMKLDDFFIGHFISFYASLVLASNISIYYLLGGRLSFLLA
jgi:hypothetical protein